MLYLLLSIVCGTSIVLLFKVVDIRKIDKLEVITLNYLTAFAAGMVLVFASGRELSIPSAGWLWSALLIGILFVIMFFVLGIAVARTGVGVSSVAAKMSVVLPILFSIIAFGEQVGMVKVIGIAMALISLALVVYRNESPKGKTSILFPIILFAGMGIVDSSVKLAQELYVSHDDLIRFSTLLFGVSSLVSTSSLFLIRKKRITIRPDLLLTGLALGLVNMGSLYFMIMALESGFRDSSLIFGINNIGIVGFSFIIGAIIFKERSTLLNKVGLILALISIYLLFSA